MNNTKIIATIGPATESAEQLLALSKSGMNIARLNGSHNHLEWHRNIIQRIREILPQTPILLDIPGRKIRTIRLNYEPSFLIGDKLILTTDLNFDGREKVPVNYKNLHLDVMSGQTILADDGTLRFTIDKVVDRDIHVIAECAGTLKSSKGINVPFVKLNTQLVTERDEQMIAFAQENRVDFIGLSFVESSEHINAIRKLIEPLSFPKVVSKIENQGGLNNMKEIIEASDAIMIDRGDLSVETQLDSIALNQKIIINAARRYAKPVIVATELLHSMIENNFPTKAEVTDITNAVLDGCACIMLSGETAIGKNPLEAVELMTRVVGHAENYKREKSMETPDNESKSAIPMAMASAIELICKETEITKIIAITRAGFAAKTLAIRNLTQDIIAISDDQTMAKSFNIYPGVKGLYYPQKFEKESLDHVMDIIKFLRAEKEISDSDLILVTAVGYPKSGNRMNLIQTHQVGDLAKTLKW